MTSWVVVHEPSVELFTKSCNTSARKHLRKCFKTYVKQLKRQILLYTPDSNLHGAGQPAPGGDKEHQLFYKGKGKSMGRSVGPWQGCLLDSLSPPVVVFRDVQGEWPAGSGWACMFCLYNTSYCQSWGDNTKFWPDPLGISHLSGALAAKLKSEFLQFCPPESETPWLHRKYYSRVTGSVRLWLSRTCL